MADKKTRREHNQSVYAFLLTLLNKSGRQKSETKLTIRISKREHETDVLSVVIYSIRLIVLFLFVVVMRG